MTTKLCRILRVSEAALNHACELSRRGVGYQSFKIPKRAGSCRLIHAPVPALRLIHEKGYEQVSMREIAREVGLPIASVYQYFPNKDALLAALVELAAAVEGSTAPSEAEAEGWSPEGSAAPSWVIWSAALAMPVLITVTAIPILVASIGVAVWGAL